MSLLSRSRGVGGRYGGRKAEGGREHRCDTFRAGKNGRGKLPAYPRVFPNNIFAPDFIIGLFLEGGQDSC